MDELEKKEQEDTSIEVDAPENADTPENNEGDKQQVKDNESDAEGDSTSDDAQKESSKDEGEAESAEELNIDDVDTPAPVQKEEEVKTFSWKNATKDLDLGIELENDDITSFKRGLSELRNKDKSEAWDEGRRSVMEGLTPDQQILINAFDQDGGATIDEIANIGAKWDKFINLDDSELYRQSLLSQGISKDIVEEMVAYAEEDGRVRFEAAQLRSTLNANKEQAKQQYITDKANMSIAHKKAIQEKDAADMKKVSDILEGVTEYNGVKISGDAKKKLVERWNSGFYRERFANDFDFTAKAILHAEFGKRFVEGSIVNIKKEVERETKSKLKEKLHNLSDTSGNKGGRVSGNNNDDFSEWEGLLRGGEPVKIVRGS